MLAEQTLVTRRPRRLAPRPTAYAAFLEAYPDYAATARLDQLRASEYSRLDAQGHVYLDYTGGGLYADCQLREHLALLSQGVFGNPHSKNLTSMAMTRLVEQRFGTSYKS